MKDKFIVIWIPDTFYIFLESEKNYLRKVKFELYKNKPVKTKEFGSFKEADAFVDELWKIK